MELFKSAIDGIGFFMDNLSNLKTLAVGIYDIIASNAVLSLSFVLGTIAFIADKVSHNR